MRTIEVRRDAISRTRAVTEAQPHPADGQAVLRVERFSLSANKLTYARLGDELGYWRFFPVADGWGRLPDVAGLNYTLPHSFAAKMPKWAEHDRRALSRHADTTGLHDSLDTTRPPAPWARAARPRPGG